MESAPFLTLSNPPRGLVRDRRSGFTLVEMIVVLAIISIITTIALLGQSTFNQSILLTDTAYTLAFSAREAQSFGLSSRKYGSVQNAGYGLHFDRVTPTRYTLFADTARTLSTPSACPLGVTGTPEEKPGNCRYDATGTSDGVVETFTFSRGFTISSFCGKSGSIRYCSTDSVALTSLDLVFTRPNTASTISGTRGSTLEEFSCAEITISDRNAVKSKTVRISQLGEVSVGQTCP